LAQPTFIYDVYTLPFQKCIKATEDDFGNIYIATWTNNRIYKIPKDLSAPPEIFSSGHNQPTGMDFNDFTGEMAVCNLGSNTIDFIMPTVGSGKTAAPSIKCQVYPNPFIDRFRIMLSLPTEGKVLITVTDITGSERLYIYTGTPGQGVFDQVFDLNECSPGIYILSIYLDSILVCSRRMVSIW
jgi:hypothetical protein